MSYVKLFFLIQLDYLVILQLEIEYYNYHFARINSNLDLVSVRSVKPAFEKTLIYLNTVVNYSIWRLRNDIKYRFQSFSLKNLCNKIIKSVGYRKNIDQQVTDTYKIPYINQLYDYLVNVVNQFS